MDALIFGVKLNKEEIILPSWMMNENNYKPKKDRNGFITKSILSFLNLFRHFHIEKNENISPLRAGNRLLLVLGLIILSALSKNLFFCGCIGAGFLLYLSMAKIDVIKRVLSTALTAAFFTLLVMLPAYFLYKSNAFIIITLKVFISAGLLSTLALITPWNKIISALNLIKVPGFIVFIFDLTIHYILILGNIAYEMLIALKLRSLGKNKTKNKSFSGIIGTVFLKSLVFAQETQQAMECRLFNGTYYSKKIKPEYKDFISIIILILYIILFVFVGY